jgi:hypothetical protein
MPAYVQHHEVEPAAIVCPSCLGNPLHIRDVEPFWSAAKLDLIYECEDCGVEVRKTMTRAEYRH